MMGDEGHLVCGDPRIKNNIWKNSIATCLSRNSVVTQSLPVFILKTSATKLTPSAVCAIYFNKVLLVVTLHRCEMKSKMMIIWVPAGSDVSEWTPLGLSGVRVEPSVLQHTNPIFLCRQQGRAMFVHQKTSTRRLTTRRTSTPTGPWM